MGGRVLVFCWLGAEEHESPSSLGGEGTRVLGLEGTHPKPHSPTGKPEFGGGFVLGAVGGAGVAGLFSLCPCLVFFM